MPRRVVCFCLVKYKPRGKMKKQTKKLLKVEPLIDYLSDSGRLTDNELGVVFKDLKFAQILRDCGFRKRSGDGLLEVMFALTIWPLLNVKSISNFCGKQLKYFIKGGVNVLYDFRKREDLKWRRLRLLVAKRVYKKNRLEDEPVRAFVFDDTQKHRRGKNVQGVSWHHDHTIGKTVRSHQVLEMGLVTPKGYLSLDSQMYIGKSDPVLRDKGFIDNCSDALISHCQTRRFLKFML